MIQLSQLLLPVNIFGGIQPLETLRFQRLDNGIIIVHCHSKHAENTMILLVNLSECLVLIGQYTPVSVLKRRRRLGSCAFLDVVICVELVRHTVSMRRDQFREGAYLDIVHGRNWH